MPTDRQLTNAENYRRELGSCTLMELQYRLAKMNKGRDEWDNTTRSGCIYALLSLRFGSEVADAIYNN